MKWMVSVVLGALSLAACDDGEGGGTVVDAAPRDDVGFVLRPEAGPTTDQGPDADVADPDMGETDDADVPSPCDPALGYGPTAASRTVTAQAAHSPRVVWTGNRWGLTWRSPAATAGYEDIWFGRVDADGQAEGEPVKVGVSRNGLHAVAWSGTRFVVIWGSARIDGAGYAGLRVQRFDPDGVADGEPVDLESTFDVSHLALAWTNGGGGMVVYGRGDPQPGSGGLFARPLSPDGAAEGPAVQVSSESIQAPAVAFGDATWGVAWQARGSARPNDLVFTVLDERGRPALESPRRVTDAGAQGQVHLAYGGSTYGVGWNQVDELGSLSMILSLYDLAGDPLGRATVTGPAHLGAITGVTWLTPNFFGVAWQDSGPGGASTVGLTRVNATGQVLTPVALPGVAGAPATGPVVAGTISKVGAFYTRDGAPLAVGFSPEARVEATLLGPCN